MVGSLMDKLFTPGNDPHGTIVVQYPIQIGIDSCAQITAWITTASGQLLRWLCVSFETETSRHKTHMLFYARMPDDSFSRQHERSSVPARKAYTRRIVESATPIDTAAPAYTYSEHRWRYVV